MTTIAVLGGVMAADTQETWNSEAGGSSKHVCTKLYRKKVPSAANPEILEEVVIGLAGATFPGLVFLDWFGSGKEIPDTLTQGTTNEEDFDALIMTPAGVYIANRLCRPVLVEDEFIAVGSGRKAAVAAMKCGRSAAEAIEIAMAIDPYTGGVIKTMTLADAKPKRYRRRKGAQKAHEPLDGGVMLTGPRP